MPHQVHPPNGGMSDWIAACFVPGYSGFGIEVGSSDGESINATLKLERDLLWTILCVEPNPFFAPALLRNRRMVETVACGDKPGQAMFHVNVEGPEACSSLRPNREHAVFKKHDRGIWQSVPVAIRTLDQLLQRWEFPRLDLLLVDTEGTEGDVLRGIDLERWHPGIIIVESWDGHVHDDYLRDFGYRHHRREHHDDLYLHAPSEA